MRQYLIKVMFMFVECITVEEEFELCLPDGEVTVHGAVGASELINTAKSGSESGVWVCHTHILNQTRISHQYKIQFQSIEQYVGRSCFKTEPLLRWPSSISARIHRPPICAQVGVTSPHHLLAGPIPLLHGSQLSWQAALGGCTGVCGGW